MCWASCLVAYGKFWHTWMLDGYCTAFKSFFDSILLDREEPELIFARVIRSRDSSSCWNDYLRSRSNMLTSCSLISQSSLRSKQITRWVTLLMIVSGFASWTFNSLLMRSSCLITESCCSSISQELWMNLIARAACFEKLWFLLTS